MTSRLIVMLNIGIGAASLYESGSARLIWLLAATVISLPRIGRFRRLVVRRMVVRRWDIRRMVGVPCYVLYTVQYMHEQKMA
jgi:hypothetical protein